MPGQTLSSGAPDRVQDPVKPVGLQLLDPPLVTELREARSHGDLCDGVDAKGAGFLLYMAVAENMVPFSTIGKRLGVDTENLLVSQPDNGEQVLEITETLVRSNAVDLIVVDSVAALTPQAEIDGDMGDSHMGLQARLMSQC